MHFIDWLVIAAYSILSLWLGAALTIRAADRRLRVGVASFLGCTSLLYALGELKALFG